MMLPFVNATVKLHGRTIFLLLLWFLINIKVIFFQINNNVSDHWMSGLVFLRETDKWNGLSSNC